MTAREMIEKEYLRSGGDPDVVHATPCSYDLAAERVIERLQQRVEELELSLHMERERVEELEREQKTMALNHKLELENGPVNCSACERWHEDREREAYRDRLDRMVAAFNASSEPPYQPDSDGKTRTYYEFITAEAVKYLAAIDAHVAGGEGKKCPTSRT